MKIVLFIVLLITAVFVSENFGQPGCPKGFIQNGTSCYVFVHQHFSWPESVTFCGVLGAHLVRINSAEEHNFLIQYSKALETIDPTFDTREYWIDLSDGVVQGEWMWTGENAGKPSYIRWGNTQPDDTPREDCVGLWKEGGYLFGDWPCDTKLHCICETEM